MGKKQTKKKKQKIEKKEKDFISGTETEEQFEKIISLLSKWIKAGIVSIDVDVDGDISFELPREMDKLLEAQVPRDLGYKKVQTIINKEIKYLIDAGLRKNTEKSIRSTMPGKLHEKMDMMVKRCEKAVTNLVDRSLKERIMLRRTTPCYVINSIRSIESTYNVEGKEGEQIKVPFISLELTFAQPRSGYMFSLNPVEQEFSAYRKDEVKVKLDLHKEDMKDFIEKLNSIEEKINNKGD